MPVVNKRPDAPEKIRGTAQYTDDYTRPGMLNAAIFCSPVDHGMITALHLPPKPQGLVLLQAADIVRNLIPEPVSDQPFLAETELSYKGQPIIVVAHFNRQIALDYVRNIRIEYTTLPALIDWREALDKAETVFGTQIKMANSNMPVEESGDLVLEEIFYTAHQEQAYLEPQAMLAEPVGDEIHVTGSLQCPFLVRGAVAAATGLPLERVIICTAQAVGGGFGGKEDVPNLLGGLVAALALKAKAPVKLVLDRAQDLDITTKRHPSRTGIRAIYNKSGIKGMDIDFRLDAGAFQTLSPVVLGRGVLHAQGGYHCPSVHVLGRLIKSHTPSNGAFRGFGAPQAFFAIESLMDDMALSLGHDPLDWRLEQLLHPGDHMATTQVVQDDSLELCLRELAYNCDWYSRRVRIEEYNLAHTQKRGLGLAIGYHGAGYTGTGEAWLASKVKIEYRGGVYYVRTAAVEMGQGAHTTLGLITARALGVNPERVRVELPNTGLNPNSGPTVASRTIYIVGGLLKKLGERIKAEGLLEQGEYVWEEQFTPDPGFTFDPELYKGAGYRDYSWCACAVEITYDPVDYRIIPTHLWAVVDIGRVIDKPIALGQLYGGFTQALGWGTGEEWYKPGAGRLHGLTDYPLPLATQKPQFDIRFIKADQDPAKGLGELPMDFPAAALRNAFLHATGIRANKIPLTPEYVHEMMQP